MKYIIIPFIALGLMLSLTIGIEYNCAGLDKFPTYYGSPFIFKKSSLASSMQYHFSISGLFLNVLVWCAFLFLLNKVIRIIIRRIGDAKWIRTLYTFIISILIVFSLFNIAIAYVTLGSGFDSALNYWYWNIDKEAQDWGMTCNGKMIIF